MNGLLWAVQILLVVIYTFTGLAKLTQTKTKLAQHVRWVNNFSEDHIRLVGLAEVLGVLGLLLPGIFNTWLWLTPLAAVGLALIMVVAAVVHIRLKEYSLLSLCIVLFVLLMVVVIGRSELIRPR